MTALQTTPRVLLLNPDHQPVGVLDDFLTLTWIRSFWGVGSVALTLPRQSPWARQVRNGWVIVPPDEIDLAYVVRRQNLNIAGSTDGQIELIAPGVAEILGDPGRRIIPASGMHDEQIGQPAESAMKHYVSAHAGPDAPSERQLPNLRIAADQGRGDDVTVQARFQPVIEVVTDIGRAAGLGWDMTFDLDDDEFVFDILVGTDRTDSVYFDLEFESILSLEWLRSQLDRSTVVYVAGQGSGEDREIVTRWQGAEPTGYDRRETLIDARDMDNTAALQSRGDARLAEDAPVDTIEVEINPRGSFRYRRDFDLGDLVTVRDRGFGLVAQARVVQVESSISAPSVIPDVIVSLGNPWPSLESKVAGDLRRRETGQP